jgi:hypothetical protein
MMCILANQSSEQWMILNESFPLHNVFHQSTFEVALQKFGKGSVASKRANLSVQIFDRGLSLLPKKNLNFFKWILA